MSILKIFFDIFRFHKKKIAFFIFTLGFFLVWLFPFSDVSDRVTAEVLKATNRQVYLRFDDLGLSLIPLGLGLKNVTVEAAPLRSPLKASEISLAPSIVGLLTFSPGVSVDANQILGGDLHITTQGAAKNHQHVKFSGDNLDLQRLVDLVTNTIRPTGKMSLQSDMNIDPQFQDQPDGKAQLQMKSVQLTNPQLPTMMGVFTLPSFSLKKVTGEVTLKSGRLQLDKLELGERSDALYANITGVADLKIMPSNQTAPVQFGAIDLTVELVMQDSFANDPSLKTVIDLMLSAHKKPPQGAGETYRFRIASSNVLMMPPQITAVP